MTDVSSVFRRQVGDTLARVLGGASWSLTTVPHDENDESGINAGGSGAVSWYQEVPAGPLPAVYVADGVVLLRDLNAISALDWKGSLTRLERIMGNRGWVRIPFDLVAGRDPGQLPIVSALQTVHRRIGAEVTDLGVDSTLDVVRYQVYRDGARSAWQKATWALGLTEPSLVIDGWPGHRLELSLASVVCPFRFPDADEIVDAEEIWAKAKVTAPRRRPPKPKGYQVQIEESERDDERFPWMLRDENLAAALGVDHAVEAEDLVRVALIERIERLDKGVVFDSEGDCFFAYAGSAPAAGQLAQLIADLVHEHRQRIRAEAEADPNTN